MVAGKGIVTRKVALSDNLKAFIEKWQERPGNLIMILHRVQQEYRYVPREVAFEVARVLDIPLAKIYGIITFYHFFKLEKPGEINLHVCTGTACYMKGANELISKLENLLDVRAGGTTADGKFSIETVRCVGCCGLAPVLMAEDEVYGKLTTEKLQGVISHYT
ncbi:NAD-reducing hydrogenase subunit HoxE [Olavius algarvensis spirochete endosymbiont]|uniref:NADH-quinone oxidoreductase subunit NuoE family protein n=1 Tax=Olavius algarvensis spirochete endosymbiont TaxID=260710 RepID=UPI00068F418F|nr:NAD(P)H-dependent oxidoreductase subunit E [Olavius algarvensis spirochete endosymbiont]VDB00160.1 NAD-reducing hydrogenase subunit HoxE [Olavius algarvensis spirochete endosymbiont]